MGRVLRHIAIVWLISLAVSVPPLVGWNDWHEKDFPGKCELSSEKYYVLFSALSSFYSPLALMCIMYVKIFLSQRKRLRQRAEAAARVSMPTWPSFSLLFTTWQQFFFNKQCVEVFCYGRKPSHPGQSDIMERIWQRVDFCNKHAFASQFLWPDSASTS